MAFLDPNVVVVYFVVHDDPPGSAQPREMLLSDPFRLVAVFLNKENGSLIKKLDWPLPSHPQVVSPSFFFPGTKGRFLVALGSTLNLYSADFRLLAHFDARSEMSPIASPSGESLLLSTGHAVDGQWTTQYELMNTEDLSVRSSWGHAATALPRNIQALWGDEFAWTSSSSLYFKDSTSAPRELLTSQGELCGSWTFIGKEHLAGPVCGAAHKLLTVSTEGKIAQEFELGFEQADGPVVASANGERFAVPTFRWGSGRNNDPDELTARVFGLNAGTPLLTLRVPRTPAPGSNYFFASYGDTRFGWGGLALSPDGELLAVKSGANVQVYRVPDSASHCAVPCRTEAEGPRSLSPQTTSSAVNPTPAASSQLIGQMLSWFPADTETVTAVTGPLPMPTLEKSNGAMSLAQSGVQSSFAEYPLLLLLDPQNHFKDAPILAAIEGSRDFRPPSGLGMMKYEGGAIAVFAEDVTAQANAYLKDSASRIVRTEQVEGHSVAVFEGKAEEDTWTTYVAFPKPNIAVAATSEDYLREVLARINGKQGERAMPDTLPEWKHVNRHAQFWAVRHYQQARTHTDPTSPSVQGAGERSDLQAIGLTFSFDPNRSKTATITYLSGDQNSFQRFEKLYFSERSPATTAMHIQYHQVQPEAIEGSYDLDSIESVQYFVFILEGLLGHAIYL
jgi:hypothetical protein